MELEVKYLNNNLVTSNIFGKNYERNKSKIDNFSKAKFNVVF
jgi:hypothetical protein